MLQLHRRREIVPERQGPGLEGWLDRADRGTGKGELAVLADHMTLFHVIDGRLG